jgi:hypothetical protein
MQVGLPAVSGMRSGRVYGKRTVANDLHVRLAGWPRDDADVAKAIAHLLEWNVQIPTGRVVQRHPLRSFEVDEMAQRPLAEPHQRDLDARRVPAGQDREVGPLEMRRRADGRSLALAAPTFRGTVAASANRQRRSGDDDG